MRLSIIFDYEKVMLFGNLAYIGTTAFTDKPVSMKYRGLFEVHNRGEGYINYMGQAGRGACRKDLNGGSKTTQESRRSQTRYGRTTA